MSVLITNKINPYNRAKYFNDKMQHVCPICSKVINPWEDLRDYLSRKEWEISGMCQECQDEIFECEEEWREINMAN